MPKKDLKQTKTGSLQSDFITLTSHQLRTPLSGMKWLLELLEQSGRGNLNKRQKDLLQKIYISNERMIALVNDLLEVSRIEAGQNKLYLQPTDLTDIIRDLIKDKKDQIKKKRLEISFTIEQEPFPLVLTETNKIKQALNNIISNAINYSFEAGKIGIDVRRQDGMMLGSIADNGPGIPKKQQNLVFSKFFRGDNILKFETNGTGLGLYITKAFIKASGGRIWFSSKERSLPAGQAGASGGKSEENKGTTFYFTLPIAK